MTSKKQTKTVSLDGEARIEDVIRQVPVPGELKEATSTVDAPAEDAIRQVVKPVDEEVTLWDVTVADQNIENTIRPVRRARSPENTTDGTAEAIDPIEPVKGPATLLNGRFLRDDLGIYRRQGETRDALADEGSKIRFIDKQMDAFEAGVELAKSKGWSAIEVTGSEQFRSEAWFHAKAAGMDVVGYEPNEKDLKRLGAPNAIPEKADPARPGLQAATAVKESATQAFDYAVEKGLSVLSTNTTKGTHTGKIVHETGHHVVQDNGRNSVTIHNKNDLDLGYKGFLNTSKTMKITYANGRGTLPVTEKDRGQGR